MAPTSMALSCPWRSRPTINSGLMRCSKLHPLRPVPPRLDDQFARGSSPMGTTALWAKVPVARTVPAAIVASVLIGRFLLGDRRGGIVRRA